MIQLKGLQADGTPIYVLGIDDGNVERLVHNQPLYVNLSNLPQGELTLMVVHKPTIEEVCKLFGVALPAEDGGAVRGPE